MYLPPGMLMEAGDFSPCLHPDRALTFSSLLPSKGKRSVPWGQRGWGIRPHGGHFTQLRVCQSLKHWGRGS